MDSQNSQYNCKMYRKELSSDKKKNDKDIQSFNFKNWLRSNTEFAELITEFKYMDKSDFPLAR